jgi:hypothetical protein
MDLISKYDLIEKIVHTDNEILLQQVKTLLEEEEVESLEDLDPTLKKALKKSISQSDRGEGTPHAVVMKRIKKEFLKKK